MSFRFSHQRVQMGHMNFISSIFFIFWKIAWEIFHLSHVTDVYVYQSPLFVLSTNSGDSQISVYIHVSFYHDAFIK